MGRAQAAPYVRVTVPLMPSAENADIHMSSTRISALNAAFVNSFVPLMPSRSNKFNNKAITEEEGYES